MKQALEKLKNWLQSWPGWQEEKIRVDALPVKLGSVGLFPLGLQIRKRESDLFGNTQCLCRLTCKLLLCSDSRVEEMAGRLLELQGWILQQSAQDLAPVLGCLPHRERIYAGYGRQEKQLQPGLWLYQLELKADFVQYWEVQSDEAVF